MTWLLTALLGALVLVLWVEGSSARDMPPYTVIAQREGFEERLYPGARWVSTSRTGSSRDALMSPMFRTLFGYISGLNEREERIPMTSPVTTFVQPGSCRSCPSNFTMAFYLPEEQQADPPAGRPGVFIEDRPPITVLTRRFGGWARGDRVAREAKELAKLIMAAGETDVDFSRFYLAGYDSPFRFFDRRNEVWYIKEATSTT